MGSLRPSQTMADGRNPFEGDAETLGQFLSCLGFGFRASLAKLPEVASTRVQRPRDAATQKLRLRSRRSIRFLPKRRASTDRTPGPSIAKAAPMAANITQLRTCPVFDTIDHASRITTKAPAMGVHRPATKSIPAAVSKKERTIPSQWGPCSSAAIPSLIKRMPETRRRSRRPLPGQPSGNIEKSRCTEASATSIGVP